MLRDESIISEESEKDEESKEDEGENTEFLAGGEDLDLPSEMSESDADLEGDDDSELENYYEEIGIADEEDYTKPKEDLYKTKTKAPKTVAKAEPAEPSKKSIMIDKLIESAKTTPTYSNVSRVIKIVKQLFNT
jgi:hypothetical protein